MTTELIAARAEIEKLRAERDALQKSIDQECEDCGLWKQNDARGQEIERLRTEVAELKEEVAMGDQCLQMISELLSSIYGDSPSTPLMMFPEWIASVVLKKASALRAEVAALKDALRTYGDHLEDCPRFADYCHGASCTCGYSPALAGKGDK
jgi:hypothetical protein